MIIKTILILFFTYETVLCQRTRDKMYDSINGKSCFRILNGTHQIGCSSTFSGSVGALHLVKEAEDFTFILRNPPAPPYAPIIYPYLFTPEYILPLKMSPYISAIIIIDNKTKIESYSPERKCPNPYSSVNGQTCEAADAKDTWNPFGTGLLYEDFNFPIYYVHEPTEIEKLLSCYEKFNDFDFAGQDQRSLCSIQINTFMAAAVDSQVCLRRSKGVITTTRFCDPLSGTNVYASLFPRPNVLADGIVDKQHKNNEKFYLITTRIDTATLFDEIGIGALGTVVPMTTLLLTGHLLKQILPKELNKNNKNVIFMFFDGESFDYIGSQRLVYDMKKGQFPNNAGLESELQINTTNIELMIDIGILDDPSSYQIYYVNQTSNYDKIVSLLNKYNTKFNINPASPFTPKQSINLPPTSAQSFLRDDLQFPAIILSTKPLNKFYHSVYDDSSNIEFIYKNTSRDWLELDNFGEPSIFNQNSIQLKIRNISSILAFTLYELITKTEYDKNIGASSVLADEFLHCYLNTSGCALFKGLSPPNITFDGVKPQVLYVGVTHSKPHDSPVWLILATSYLIGDKRKNETKETCIGSLRFWMAGFDGQGSCYQSSGNFSSAISPAFLEDDYDWKSGKYSTWTESTWNALSAQIFLRPSRTHEAATLSIGVVVLIISFLLVFCINSKSDVLFGNSMSSVSNEVQPAHC